MSEEVAFENVGVVSSNSSSHCLEVLSTNSSSPIKPQSSVYISPSPLSLSNETVTPMCHPVLDVHKTNGVDDVKQLKAVGIVNMELVDHSLIKQQIDKSDDVDFISPPSPPPDAASSLLTMEPKTSTHALPDTDKHDMVGTECLITSFEPLKEFEESLIEKESKASKHKCKINNDKVGDGDVVPSTSKIVQKKLKISQTIPVSTPTRESKRLKVSTSPYQYPVKMPKINLRANEKEKLKTENDPVFFKMEFLAVRSAEGGFYVCQAWQNVYRESKIVKIRWFTPISSGSEEDPDVQVYQAEYHDKTAFKTILTSIEMKRIGKVQGVFQFSLSKNEKQRIKNILDRSVQSEAGAIIPRPYEDNPDGLDISIYKDTQQLHDLFKETNKQNKKMKERSISDEHGLKDEVLGQHAEQRRSSKRIKNST